VSTPVRPERPTAEVRPPSGPRPRATRKKKGGRRLGLTIGLLIILAIYLPRLNSHTHHAPSPKDRSDLMIVPASTTVPAGGAGVIAIRLTNLGPDELDHTVTFTFTTSPGLTITGAGTIDEGGKVPFNPSHDCTLQPNGTLLTCQWFVDIYAARHDTWHLPVRVVAGTTPGTALRLNVTAVGNSLYTDPNKANNSRVGLPVIASRGGKTPPTSRPTVAASHPPSTPRTSASQPVPSRTESAPRPTSTASHKPVGTRIRDNARKAVAPITIVLVAIVGLALLIVALLILVARRQRKLPLDYIPPPRHKGT
jgi:hypothetical protein